MVAQTLSRARIAPSGEQIAHELALALRDVSGKELVGWGVGTGTRFGRGLWRRTSVLAGVAVKAGSVTVSGSKALYGAAKDKRLKDHLRKTAATAKTAVTDTASSGWRSARCAPALVRAMALHPSEYAPRVLGATIGLLCGSGGLDGNGGYGPDIDLFFGIGAHRSIWTHSFFLTAVAEALVLSSVELTELVYGKLPDPHHPMWNGLQKHGRAFAEGLVGGYGVGVAYHLTVDGLLQPAAIKGLGVRLPMEAHQGLLAAFGMTEAAYQMQGKAGKVEP